MKNIALLLLVFTIISCGSQQQKEVQDTGDLVKSGPGCEELESIIDSLNDEISDLKSEASKRSEISHKKSTNKAESKKAVVNTSEPKAKTKATPKVQKRDSDGSMRCTASGCKRRTFSGNGFCWQHGGN